MNFQESSVPGMSRKAEDEMQTQTEFSQDPSTVAEDEPAAGGGDHREESHARAEATPEGPQADGAEEGEGGGGPPDSAGEGGEAYVEPAPGEADLARQLEEQKEQYLRLAADFDNHRRRSQNEAIRREKEGRRAVLRAFLPVLDSFHLARQAMESQADPEAVRAGIIQIKGLLDGVLERLKVETIPSVGESFDPHRHEALMSAPSTEHDEGVVSVEIRPGYLHEGEVLRAAQVGVSQGAPAPAEEEAAAEAAASESAEGDGPSGSTPAGMEEANPEE